MRALFIPLLLAGVLLTACDRIIEFDMPRITPVVVNCLFHADSTWSVRVMRAVSMGEDVYDRKRISGIGDADVTIIPENGSPITLAYDTNGYYISKEKPVPGTRYDLEVNVPGDKLVTASTTLLPTVKIDTAYIAATTERSATIAIEFTDIPGPTWYQFRVRSNGSSNIDMQIDDPDATLDTYWKPTSDFSAELGPSYLVLSDRSFQGKKKVVKITKSAYFYDSPLVFEIEMRTLSDEYARYRATAYQQQNISDDPFAQPIPVFNNITNGVGIFGGLSTTSCRIE